MAKRILHINDKIKAYFIDLDGTLLDDKDHTGKIPSYMNVEGCKYAKSIGKSVVISTGREFSNSRAHAKRVGAKYIISSNGAAIHDVDGKLLTEHFLSDSSYRNTVKIAKDNKMVMVIRGDKNVYGVTNSIKRFIIKRFFGMKSIKGYGTQALFASHKIILIGKKEKLENVKEELLQTDEKINVVFQRRLLEITHVNASKGKAALWLAKKKLKVKPDECAHIGDTENDASTCDVLGVSVAMKNSSEEYLHLASHIGPHYKGGGVAKVIAGDYRENIIKETN